VSTERCFVLKCRHKVDLTRDDVLGQVQECEILHIFECLTRQAVVLTGKVSMGAAGYPIFMIEVAIDRVVIGDTITSLYFAVSVPVTFVPESWWRDALILTCVPKI